MLMYSRPNTCLKHSDFLKVNVLNNTPHSQVQLYFQDKCSGCAKYSPRGRTSHPQQKSNYELFNRNNLNIRYWSWNYRGCWHQTCPPIDPRETVLKCTHSNYKASDESCIVIFRHYLELRSLGNLRACCLPWMW